MNGTERNPCPFCGCPWTGIHGTDGGQAVQLNCLHCHATGPSVKNDDYKSVDERDTAAIEAWNARFTPKGALATRIPEAAQGTDENAGGGDQPNEDALLDAMILFCNKVGQQNEFSTIWSILSDEQGKYFTPPEDYFATPVPTKPRKVTYDGGWGKSGTVDLPANPTLLDLWRAADTLIRMSGDAHHIYIERFTPVEGKKSTLKITTGS